MYNIRHEDDPQKKIQLKSNNNNDFNNINIINNKKNTELTSLNEDELFDENGLDILVNQSKKNDQQDLESENNYTDNDDEILIDDEQNYSDNGGDFDQDPLLSHEEIMHQKAYYLSQLHRLEQKGIKTLHRLDMSHSLDIIKGEYLRLEKNREIENGVSMCWNVLNMCVNGIEMLNHNYDPFNVNLDGWSNTVHASKDQYEPVLEELYEKYRNTISTGPEIKLILMLGGSAAMFALTNNKSTTSMFSNGIGNFSKPKQTSQMRGPSIDTDDLLNKLNRDSDSDISDLSDLSKATDISIVEKTIEVPKKKRGRKPKQKT